MSDTLWEMAESLPTMQTSSRDIHALLKIRSEVETLIKRAESAKAEEINAMIAEESIPGRITINEDFKFYKSIEVLSFNTEMGNPDHDARIKVGFSKETIVGATTNFSDDVTKMIAEYAQSDILISISCNHEDDGKSAFWRDMEHYRFIVEGESRNYDLGLELDYNLAIQQYPILKMIDCLPQLIDDLDFKIIDPAELSDLSYTDGESKIYPGKGITAFASELNPRQKIHHLHHMAGAGDDHDMGKRYVVPWLLDEESLVPDVKRCGYHWTFEYLVHVEETMRGMKPLPIHGLASAREYWVNEVIVENALWDRLFAALSIVVWEDFVDENGRLLVEKAEAAIRSSGKRRKINKDLTPSQRRQRDLLRHLKQMEKFNFLFYNGGKKL